METGDISVKYTTINRKKVGYFDEGKGPVLIMIHGWTACKESFIPIIHALKGNYRIIAPDLPGHGDSEPLKGKHDFENYTLFLHDFISGLGIGNFSLFGTSYGGGLAISYAISYSEQIDRLILQAPFFSSTQLGEKKDLPKFVSRPNLLRLVKLLLKSRLIRKFYIRRYVKDAEAHKIPEIRKHMDEHSKEEGEKIIGYVLYTFKKSTSSKAITEQGLGLLKTDFIRALPGIKQDTLIFWGTEDTVLSPKGADTLRTLIPHSKLLKIDGATHFVILEKPDIISSEIAGFLSS